MQLLFRTKTVMPQIGQNSIMLAQLVLIWQIGNFQTNSMVSMPGSFPVPPYPLKVFLEYFAAAKIDQLALLLQPQLMRPTSIHPQAGILTLLARILAGMVFQILLSMFVHTTTQDIPKIQFFIKTKPLLYLALRVLWTALQPHAAIIQVKHITRGPTSS